MNAVSSIESRALSMLASGVQPVAVAAALGVTESAISQLKSKPEFAAQLAQAQYEYLEGYAKRDSKYDKIEDNLLSRLEDMVPMMTKPHEIVRALQVVNSATRRGQNSLDGQNITKPVVQLNMPVTFINNLKISGTNEVLAIGERELLTIQSKDLRELAERQPERKSNAIESEGVRKRLTDRSFDVADL